MCFYIKGQSKFRCTLLDLEHQISGRTVAAEGQIPTSLHDCFNCHFEPIPMNSLYFSPSMKGKFLGAVMIGDAKAVQQLLEAAAWPAVFAAAVAPNGSICDTALHIAVLSGFTDVAESLLAAGAAVDA